MYQLALGCSHHLLVAVGSSLGIYVILLGIGEPAGVTT